MNLRQLRYFCEIVDAGSAAQAAERLCIAPTAISMQLSQLEERVGGELFDRARRPMELTALGRFFYPRAKELLAQARRLDEEAQGMATGKRGWLGIGFVRSTLFSILPRTARIFRERYPDVQIDLIEMLSEYQPAQLRSERIHVGLSRFIGHYERDPDLTYTHVLDDPFVAALPIDHPLAEKPSLSLRDFNNQALIRYPKDARSAFAQHMQQLLINAEVRSASSYEAIEIHTALALVGAGLGITLVGQSVTENNRSDVVFRPINDLQNDTTLVAITRQDENSKVVAAFLDILLNEGVNR